MSQRCECDFSLCDGCGKPVNRQADKWVEFDCATCGATVGLKNPPLGFSKTPTLNSSEEGAEGRGKTDRTLARIHKNVSEKLAAEVERLEAERAQIRNVIEAIDKEWPTDGARALLLSIRAALNPERVHRSRPITLTPEEAMLIVRAYDGDLDALDEVANVIARIEEAAVEQGEGRP